MIFVRNLHGAKHASGAASPGTIGRASHRRTPHKPIGAIVRAGDQERVALHNNNKERQDETIGEQTALGSVIICIRVVWSKSICATYRFLAPAQIFLLLWFFFPMSFIPSVLV